MTGRWITCIDENQMRDIRVILPCPLSGSMLKHRCRAHELWAEELLKEVKDAELKALLNRVLDGMRAVQKQIPDGLAHHMYCVAYYTQNKKCLDTVLFEEEREKAEPAALLPHAAPKGMLALGRDTLISGGSPSKTLRASLGSRAHFFGKYPGVFEATKHPGFHRNGR